MYITGLYVHASMGSHLEINVLPKVQCHGIFVAQKLVKVAGIVSHWNYFIGC